MSFLKKLKSKSFNDIIKILFLKVLNTQICTFHYLVLELDKIPLMELEISSRAKELNITDFETGDKNIFNANKLKLIRERLESSNYKAYGIIENNELIYSTWISYGYLTLPNGMKFAMDEKESLLEDSYCSVKARGRGFHSQMNIFRIQKIKQDGKNRVIAIVLDGNTPAMKVQKKSGFKEAFSFKSGYILGKPFTTKLKK